MTQDHTVPKMYLKRFALETKPDKEWQISIRKKKTGHTHKQNVNRVSTVSDFYLGKGLNGKQTHAMEDLLCVAEGAATAVFKSMLDTDNAKPEEWGLQGDERRTIATWIAMQMLRTKRIRKMLAYEQYGSKETDAVLKEARVKDDHLSFMYSRQPALTDEIISRPWGFGFCDTGLITGDTPVVVLNGQDDPNGSVPFQECTVLLPLDSSRLLILPAKKLQDRDFEKMSDHLFKLPKGAAWGVNNAVYAAADDAIFHHPDLSLDEKSLVEGFDIKTLWGGAEEASAPLWDIDYDVMSADEDPFLFSPGEHVGIVRGDAETTIYVGQDSVSDILYGMEHLQRMALERGNVEEFNRIQAIKEQMVQSDD